MGSVFSRWKKKKTTAEILEGIDKEILRIEKFRKSTQDLRSKVIGNLILYSIIIYIFACLALYFFYIPSNYTEQCLRLLPLFCFPFIIYLLKRFLHWWFVRKISKNELQMQELKDQRKEILENVMETETYKKAKEILEKFDPETKQKLEEERRLRESPSRLSSMSSPDTELRRRNAAPQSPQLATPRPQFQSPPLRTPGPSSSMISTPMPMTPAPRMPGPRPSIIPVLPRTLLRQDRSALERLVEYFVGDGPGNRYALICQNCFSHNGMALREEFEYIEYRCAYCGFFNPARKQRPTAPRLPARVSSPMVKRNGVPRLGENKDEILCRISSTITEENESDISGDQGSDSMASETRSCSTKDDFASSEETVGSVTTDFESALADDAAKTGLDDKSNDLEKRKTVPEMQPDEI